jgi:hypothetical protein
MDRFDVDQLVTKLFSEKMKTKKLEKMKSTVSSNMKRKSSNVVRQLNETPVDSQRDGNERAFDTQEINKQSSTSFFKESQPTVQTQ